MLEPAWLITEWTGDSEDPLMVMEYEADAAEWCARENRRGLPKEISWLGAPLKFSYEPIMFKRGDK
jgi:hypothetical protein